jgi:hypothetical protein
MGVAISSHSSLAPVSLASLIVGFIGFAVTAATLIKISWDNIETVWSAPQQINDYLGNLKAGLYEERHHLRKVCRTRSKSRRRRRSRSASARHRRGRGGGEKEPVDDESSPRELAEDRTLVVLKNTVRHMLRNFRNLERPFVAYEHEIKRRASRKLSEGDWDMERYPDNYGDDSDGGESIFSAAYKECGLKERFIWLRTKGKVMSLSDGLQKIQTRRIATELGQVYVYASFFVLSTRCIDWKAGRSCI